MMEMRSKARTLALLAGVAAVALVAGCTSPVAGPTPSPSGAAVTPTEAPKPDAALPEVAASGSVVTPKQGDVVRTALMDAARVKLGTSSQFYVLALKTDGAWAVAALRTVDGGKGAWVAFRNELPGGWVAFWSGDVTDSGKAVKAADARFADAVLAATDLEMDVGKPTVAEAEAAVLKIAKKTYPTIPTKTAKAAGLGVDSKGAWWVQAWTDAGLEYEGEQWFAYYDGTTWKLKEYGTGLERSDLPADITWTDVP
jgi:hypothetical protein